MVSAHLLRRVTITVVVIGDRDWPGVPRVAGWPATVGCYGVLVEGRYSVLVGHRRCLSRPWGLGRSGSHIDRRPILPFPGTVSAESRSHTGADRVPSAIEYIGGGIPAVVDELDLAALSRPRRQSVPASGYVVRSTIRLAWLHDDDPVIAVRRRRDPRARRVSHRGRGFGRLGRRYVGRRGRSPGRLSRRCVGRRGRSSGRRSCGRLASADGGGRLGVVE